MHLLIGVSVFFQLLGFLIIILFLIVFFSTDVLFLNRRIDIYDDDNNEAQRIHGQSSFRLSVSKHYVKHGSFSHAFGIYGHRTLMQ